jgi:hypothetical protein
MRLGGRFVLQALLLRLEPPDHIRKRRSTWRRAAGAGGSRSVSDMDNGERESGYLRQVPTGEKYAFIFRYFCYRHGDESGKHGSVFSKVFIVFFSTTNPFLTMTRRSNYET